VIEGPRHTSTYRGSGLHLIYRYGSLKYDPSQQHKGMFHLAHLLLCIALCWSTFSPAQDTISTYRSELLKVAHLNKEN